MYDLIIDIIYCVTLLAWAMKIDTNVQCQCDCPYHYKAETFTIEHNPDTSAQLTYLNLPAIRWATFRILRISSVHPYKLAKSEECVGFKVDIIRL